MTHSVEIDAGVDDRCLNCNAPVRVISYALGERLMHVNPDAGFPTEQKGTAWRHCKQQVATTSNEGNDHA